MTHKSSHHQSVVRTRFAPSPTGFMHIGGIRTALFAWLLARQNGGQFVLRLEDTDQKRQVDGSDDHIVKSLQSLGMDYDEGPDKTGGFGPYRQSLRLDIYRAWAQKLIDSGRAYADPYSAEELQAFRDQAKREKRAFLYRDHRPEQPPVWDGSTPLRFKSEPKSYTWQDQVMGELSTGPEVIDDFILIKSDGYPTYNFAHIVDDAEMEITHVIRGQEFISSQPNYLNLYEALGFDMSGLQHQASAESQEAGEHHVSTSQPEASADLQEAGEHHVSTSRHEASAELQGVEQDFEFISKSQRRGGPLLPTFATMPHIMAPAGNKKLGKRDGAQDVLQYLEDGYTPEAMLNFIATLGWNDGTEQEVFTTDELIQKFSLDRVGRSGARFDIQRLTWLNGQHIRMLPLDDLAARVADFWPDSAAEADQDYKLQVLQLAQDRLKTLHDLPTLTQYFFTEPTVDWELIDNNKQLKKLSAVDIQQLLVAARAELNQVDDWKADSIQASLNSLLEATGRKPGVLFSLIRVATTWAPFSPQLDDTLALLGQDTSLARLDHAIDIVHK